MIKKYIAIIVCVCFLISTLGCGGISKAPQISGEKEKLARVIDKGVIGGVCSGFAYFTGTPTWIWRAGFIITTLLWGVGVGIYIVTWILMPKYDKTPYNFEQRTE